jgi:peptidoglycan/LPS O-acetylase OafA/YrhL
LTDDAGLTVGRDRLGYIPALDGLRGVAIVLVIACHYFRFPLDGGPVGVGLFFVLSGFLITTLLLEERADSGGVRIGRFYARRARRLLPALAVLLVVYLVVRGAKGEDGVAVAAAAGLYVGNVVQAFGVDDVLSGTCLAHLWSLAQEEQFYLVWPFLLLLGLRARRVLLWLSLALAALIVYRAALTLGGASAARLYYAPDTRADALLAGAVLAVWRHRGGLSVAEPVALAGFTVVFFGLFVNPWAHAWSIWQAPLIVAGSAALVAASCGSTQMAALLSSRPLVGIGKVSYSLYLWHVPIFCAFGYRRPELALPAAALVAALSYRYVEQPFRRRSLRVTIEGAPLPVASS